MGIVYELDITIFLVHPKKGAERKIRDEERKALRKKQKSGQYSMIQSSDLKGTLRIIIWKYLYVPLVSPLLAGKKHDIVYFRTISDTSNTPFYFTPESNTSADPMVRHLQLLKLKKVRRFYSRPSSNLAHQCQSSTNHRYLAL